jgi:hypothetical protein
MEDLIEEPEKSEFQEPSDSGVDRDLKGHEADGIPQESFEPFPSLPVPPDIPLEPETEMKEESGPGMEEDDEKEDEEYEEREEETHPATLRIDESLLDRVQQVFVEPLNYSRSVAGFQRIAGSYIIIIYGDEHAGKLTCALHLAQDLLDRKGAEKRIYCYRRRSDEALSLLDFVQQEYFADERVYIIEDAFPSVSLEDLEAATLYHLNEKLRDKRSFLILTTERPVRALPGGVVRVSASVRDLEKVFFNHLDLYETDSYATEGIRIEKPVLALARESWDALRQELKDPDQIDEFCRRLGVQGGLPDAEGLQKLAHEIALRRIEATRPWFGGLALHEKLFAFLVVLFPGRDGRSLYETFLTVVARLRDHGMNLTDPREIGYNDLLDRIRASESPTREISFHERAIGTEVEWQVKNYNYLLWFLVPWFLEEVKKSRGKDGGETRKSWAAAVGRIGLHQPARLREELKELARHPTKEVAAAAGYAFSEVCLRDRDAEQEVCDALRSWVASRESRLMWTASSCIFRVYGALKRSERDTTEARSRLLDTLEGLIAALEGRQPFGEEDWKTAWTIASRNARDARAAERQARDLLKAWAKENRKGARYAVGQIAAVDPEGMVERLRLWLTSGRPELRQASLHAIRRLFEGATREAGPPRQRHSVIVALIEPVLAHCGEGSRVTAALFNALAKWTDKWPDQPVSSAAMAALLKAANRLTGRAARAFRSALAPWLASPAPHVRRLGGTLFMRSLLLEGAAVPALESFQGALVLDASMEALGDEGYEPAARRIWNLLQPRLDLRLARMGERRELAEPGDLFPSRAVLDGSRPRLLLPALAAFDGEDLRIVIVLATGPILDLEEVLMAGWSSRLLLANLGQASQQPALPRAIRIDPRSPQGGMTDLVAKVDDGFVATLARAGAGAPADEGLEVSLENWVAELDEPQSLNNPVDRALAIFQAILGLAESDLDRCSALLSRWLGPDRNDLEQRVGSAAVRLLLRIDAHRDPPPASVQTCLFHLAAELGACGPEGLETALAAVRRWLTMEEWTGTLLGSHGDESAALPQWIESLLPANAEFLSRTLADWRRPSSDDSAGAAQLAETAAWLGEWIASRASDPKQPSTPDVGPEPVVPIDPPPAGRRIEVLSSHTTDPLGFPMVWIEEIGAFMHWLPVTKIQFERFIAGSPGPRFDDTWYRGVLNLNPRVAVPEIGPDNYWNAFITGVLPEEARRFAAWCGGEYALPTTKDWQKAYDALTAVPVSPGKLPGLLEGEGDLVRSALSQIEAASAAAVRSGRGRTRADQMLMRLGVLEWAEQTGGAVPWAGMGEPAPHFCMLWSIEKGPAIPLDAGSSRSSVFGFRLIRRPA